MNTDFPLSRFTHAALKSVYLFFYSLSFISLSQWSRFWFTFPAHTTISLNGLKISIRTGSLNTKAVDLYMAVSCILWKQYEHPGYAIGINATILDIGSHIGSFALWAGRTAGRVIAFEPDSSNFDMLRRNIEANKALNIMAVNKAVSDTTGTLTFFKHGSNSARHSTVVPSLDFYRIESLSLDDIFSAYDITECQFMKIDCEGAEFAILSAASRETLEKIKRLSMEYHTGYELEKLINILESAGFRIIKNEPDSSYQGQIWALR